MKDREFLKEVEQGIFKEPFMVERTPHAGVTLSFGDLDYIEEYVIHVNGKSENYFVAFFDDSEGDAEDVFYRLVNSPIITATLLKELEFKEVNSNE